VQRNLGSGLVGLQGAIEQVVEANDASLFVYEEDGHLGDLATEPGLAQGETDGKVDGEESFFGAGVADEEIEAGTEEETFDEPFEDGRGTEGVGPIAQDAIAGGAIFAHWSGGIDGGGHGEVIGKLLDDGEEGVEAIISGATDEFDVLVGDAPLEGQAVRLGCVTELYKSAENRSWLGDVISHGGAPYALPLL